MCILLTLTLYGDLSKRVMNTIKTRVNQIEVYSIDEAQIFLILDEERASLIKNKVDKWTGIPISIGIAKTKTLMSMRIISKKYKREGVFMFDSEDLIKIKMSSVEDLWGIGRKISKRLKKQETFILIYSLEKQMRSGLNETFLSMELKNKEN